MHEKNTSATPACKGVYMGFVMKLQGRNTLLFKIFSRNNFKDRQKLSYVIPSIYYRTVPVHEL